MVFGITASSSLLFYFNWNYVSYHYQHEHDVIVAGKNNSLDGAGQITKKNSRDQAAAGIVETMVVDNNFPACMLESFHALCSSGFSHA